MYETYHTYAQCFLQHKHLSLLLTLFVKMQYSYSEDTGGFYICDYHHYG